MDISSVADEVVKYLVSIGADIMARNTEALRMADLNGHKNVVDYIMSILNQ